MKFNATKDESIIIEQIAERMINLLKDRAQKGDKFKTIMDLDACHSNGNPLKLQALLEADDYNFTHDVIGIRNHINRTTGKLQDFFSPRFSA